MAKRTNKAAGAEQQKNGMNSEFFDALDLLEKDKGIPKEYMLEKVEAALVTAYKRDYGQNADVNIVVDEEKKLIKMYCNKVVADPVEDEVTQISLEEARKVNPRFDLGDVVPFEVEPKEFGRISAQTGKQVIIQGIREAERGALVKTYESKEQEILTGVVRRVDPRSGNIAVELDKGEAVLTKQEQVSGEELREGDRIKVYVIEVRSDTKGPFMMISRTHPGLVRRLFELEIPEIMDGTVIIKAISREAGSRTKIAVWSRDENVDPIGACIGPRGIRVSNIVAELHGEKIDIIRYHEDPMQFIAESLSPAAVIHVEQDGEKTCRVVVPDDQLSLVIGKEGQNARLAAKLTGWKIDIKPASAAGETDSI